MRVLVVCSYNSGTISPFIQEQVDSLKQIGIEFSYFKIQGKGVLGYLKNFNSLKRKIRGGNYDLIHAHYGLSGLLSVLQKLVPVVITYHGSDINKSSNNVVSSFTGKLCRWNIYVSKKLFKKLYIKPKNYSIIPCGINLSEIDSMSQKEARRKLGMNLNKRYILFSSSFNRLVKNSDLAKQAVSYIDNAELLQLKGYSRQEVTLLMNACDLLLMTSFTEGSPQVIKEAMACNTPVVSTDVGDVEEVIKNTEECYMVGYNAKEIAQKINAVLQYNAKTKGRAAVQRFDNHVIATQIKKVYKKVLN